MTDSATPATKRPSGKKASQQTTFSSAQSAVAMRERSRQLRAEGYVQSAIWCGPDAIKILNETQKKLGQSSRSETVNRLIEFLAADKDLYREFLAVTT